MHVKTLNYFVHLLPSPVDATQVSTPHEVSSPALVCISGVAFIEKKHCTRRAWELPRQAFAAGGLKLVCVCEREQNIPFARAFALQSFEIALQTLT